MDLEFLYHVHQEQGSRQKKKKKKILCIGTGTSEIVDNFFTKRF